MSHLFPRAGGGGGSSNAGGFVPSPGLGHELGVMFGGIGAMLLGRYRHTLPPFSPESSPLP